jgi:hypothetical protein
VFKRRGTLLAMSDQRRLDAVNRAVAEHVQRLRERLQAGRDEIARQQRVLDETRAHMEQVQRFAEATERHLNDQRVRRSDDDAAEAAEAVA